MYVKDLDVSDPAALEAELETAPLHTLACVVTVVAGSSLAITANVASAAYAPGAVSAGSNGVASAQ